MTAATGIDPLVARGVACGLLGALFGDDVVPLASGESLPTLREALGALGEGEHAAAARAALEELASCEMPPAADVHRARVRLFELGRIPPYESGFVPTGGAGHTALLADVAGFYRAFGVQVRHDRSDHVAAELEFLGLLLLGEAHHRRAGDEEGVAAYSSAAALFLRDHIGTWADRLQARLEEKAPESPYRWLAAVAAAVVADEVARRGVVVVRPPEGRPVPEDPADEAPWPRCGADDGWSACDGC